MIIESNPNTMGEYDIGRAHFFDVPALIYEFIDMIRKLLGKTKRGTYLRKYLLMVRVTGVEPAAS